MSDNTNNVLQSISSEKNGQFSFKNIAPGNYRVQASHSEWRLRSSEVKVNVQSDSQSIIEGLVILGYPVQGQVVSEGEPIQNVIFSLFSRDDDATANCGLDAPSVSFPVEENSDWKLVCQTFSNLKGQFQFPVVQPGHYKIVPLYQGENIRFDITPATFEFDVEDSRLILTQKFEVIHRQFTYDYEL
jgi:protocatechuate 3,4-dioxygenase beta subunit